MYIYDLVLNFNDKLYEFYEWDKLDNIMHIKKIDLYKIDSNKYNDLLNNKVVFNKDFLSNVFNHCEYFCNKKVKNIPYAFIVTDSYRVMALLLNSKGMVIKYSSLLLDEEEDTLDISNSLTTMDIEYNIIDKLDNNDLTRNEEKIINYLKKAFNNWYTNKEYDKLKYFYYEYFNKNKDNYLEMYNDLNNLLDNEMNNKIVNLYDIINLVYNGNSVK